tara:strand:- start:119 stop:388 length:270 start_codon:yes stop_codon:yes gene_type:complete
MAKTKFLETGCYVDGSRGDEAQNIDIVSLARFLAPNETTERMVRESKTQIDDWLISVAIDVLNARPFTPADAYWGFVDGDFGMWSVHDD